MNKSVLLIAYYFPPLGMGGVQRMAKLAKYLPRFGYNVRVLTVKPIRYPAYDPSLLDELPAQVEIFRSGSRDPARISRFLPLPIRVNASAKTFAKQKGSLFWPDAKAGWFRPAVRAAVKIMTKDNVDVILSSSPPITAHLVAMEIKKRFHLPWVADFRDFWESRPPEDVYRDQERVGKSYRLLDDIAGAADAVTRVNDAIMRARTDNAITIMGGYDPDDFENSPRPERNEYFTLCFLGNAGSLTPIEPFFAAARRVLESDSTFDRQVRFVIVGANDADEIARTAARYGLTGRIEQTGYLPHRQALRKASESAVLLISLDRRYRGILPGRVFDCLALPAPILAAVPIDGEAARLIGGHNGGICVDPDDIDGLAGGMIRLYQLYRNGTAWEKRGLSGFTRIEAARQFAVIFDELISG